jgi:O-antigen/teichoic acid export membrane protein
VRGPDAEVLIRTTSRGLARAGVIGIAGAAAVALFAWLRAKGLALALGPDGVGLYGQLWAFVLYASAFASLGIGVGTTALIAFHRERGERAEIATVTRTSLVLPAIAGTGVALLAVALAVVLAPLVLAGNRPWLIVVAAISIPFAAIQLPLQHVLQGFEDVGGQNVVYAVYGAVFTVAAVTGAYLGGVYGAAVGLAIGNAFLAALYLVRTWRLLERARAPLRLAHRGAGSPRPLLRIGAASLMITLVWGAADLAVRTTLLHTHGSSTAGYWFALLTLSVQFIGTLAGAMSYFTAPLAARSLASDKRKETRRLLDDSLRLSIAVIMPVLAFLVATRREIVGVLFSDAFNPMAEWLPMQLSGEAIRTVGWVLGVALVPLGLTRMWLVTGVGASVVFGSVGSLFAYRWGLGGAAAAWAITWTASTVVTGAVLIRSAFWRPSPRTLVGLFVSATALGATTLLPGTIGVAFAVLATAVLFAILPQPSERARLLRALRTVRRT